MSGHACQTAPSPAAVATSGAAGDLAVVVVAAGSGERFGRPGGKALVEVAGRPLVAWSLLAADAAPSVAELVLVCRPDDMEAMERLVAGLPLALPVTVVAGGADRQASCAAGLGAVSPEMAFVAFHDGARPLVGPHAFEAVAARLRADSFLGGAVVGHRCTDTVKVVADGVVVSTPDRESLWVVQTPQAFPRDVIARAHGRAGSAATDDAALVEALGLPVAVVDAQHNNLKLTYPEDLAVIEAALAAADREGE
ncbi:2-C-methyl-D-erythritol 4-phosphate cytidylyltransferase [Atopobiaceae bacterium 24-176]